MTVMTVTIRITVHVIQVCNKKVWFSIRQRIIEFQNDMIIEDQFIYSSHESVLAIASHDLTLEYLSEVVETFRIAFNFRIEKRKFQYDYELLWEID